MELEIILRLLPLVYGRQVSRLRQTLKANLLHPTLKEYSPPLSDMFIWLLQPIFTGGMWTFQQKSPSEHQILSMFQDISKIMKTSSIVKNTPNSLNTMLFGGGRGFIDPKSHFERLVTTDITLYTVKLPVTLKLHSGKFDSKGRASQARSSRTRIPQTTPQQQQSTIISVRHAKHLDIRTLTSSLSNPTPAFTALIALSLNIPTTPLTNNKIAKLSNITGTCHTTIWLHRTVQNVEPSALRCSLPRMARRRGRQSS